MRWVKKIKRAARPCRAKRNVLEKNAFVFQAGNFNGPPFGFGPRLFKSTYMMLESALHTTKVFQWTYRLFSPFNWGVGLLLVLFTGL